MRFTVAFKFTAMLLGSFTSDTSHNAALTGLASLGLCDHKACKDHNWLQVLCQPHMPGMLHANCLQWKDYAGAFCGRLKPHWFIWDCGPQGTELLPVWSWTDKFLVASWFPHGSGIHHRSVHLEWIGWVRRDGWKCLWICSWPFTALRFRNHARRTRGHQPSSLRAARLPELREVAGIPKSVTTSWSYPDFSDM